MTKRYGSLRAAALAALATVGLATAASAQWRVTGFAGVYAPTADIGKYTVSAGGDNATIAMKHKTGFIVGMNANNWFADHAGFEGTFAYVNSDATTSGSGTITNVPFAGSMTNSGYLFLGAAKFLYGITSHRSAQHLYIAAGPAVIGAGGSAYNEQEGIKTDRSTSFGGVVGLGARMRLTDILCFKLGADNYMYSTKIKMYDTATPTTKVDLGSKFQNDLVFSAGLSLAMPW